MSFKNKSVLITGGSRGIGKAIALALAKDGAKIAICAKTTEPHPKLPGTIHSAVEEINAAGGEGLAIKTDIRFEEQVVSAIEQTVGAFGGLDIVINNASAISLTGTEYTSMKRYDLMHQINARGTFMVSKFAVPELKKSENAHILSLAPPLNMEARWFQNHVAYTMAKYGMSMCVLGMAAEFADDKIAVNALWPRTAIATAAVKNLLGGETMIQQSRTVDIVADAAYLILSKNSAESTGNFFIDEDVLKEAGVEDFKKYAVNPEMDLIQDFFV